jgi:hypothetical protein
LSKSSTVFIVNVALPVSNHSLQNTFITEEIGVKQFRLLVSFKLHDRAVGEKLTVDMPSIN